MPQHDDRVRPAGPKAEAGVADGVVHGLIEQGIADADAGRVKALAEVRRIVAS